MLVIDRCYHPCHFLGRAVVSLGTYSDCHDDDDDEY